LHIANKISIILCWFYVSLNFFKGFYMKSVKLMAIGLLLISGISYGMAMDEYIGDAEQQKQIREAEALQELLLTHQLLLSAEVIYRHCQEKSELSDEDCVKAENFIIEMRKANAHIFEGLTNQLQKKNIKNKGR
jgi:hypothetical protein